MNNLKRVLSLGLSGVMLAGLLTVGASAADFTDAEDIQHDEAVNVLCALKIIDGKPDGSFAPEENVSRAQMAKMIAVAMNGGNEPGANTNTDFTDVPEKHWAASYIKYCYDLGIISGRGDGTFDPEANVTGYEATKMVLTAMGFDAEAYKLNGAKWATRTDEVARTMTGQKYYIDSTGTRVNLNEPNMYEELIGIAMNAPATRDTAAQLIWNGLQNRTRTVQPTTTSEGGTDWTYITNSTTLLEQRYGATIVTGTYTGNHLSDDKGEKGEIAVTVSDGSSTTTHYFPSEMGIENIGEEVKVIYKEGKEGRTGPDRKDTIYGVFNTGKTEVHNITKSDLQTTDAGKVKFDDTTYNMAVDSSNTLLGVNVYTDFQNTSGTGSNSKAANAGITNDKSVDRIKFICDDTGRISTAYVVRVFASKVTNATASKISINGVGTIDLDEHDVYADAAKGDVVFYTKYYSGDNTYYTVRKTESAEGELDSYKKTGKTTGNHQNVVLDGTTYKFNGEPGDNQLLDLTDDAVRDMADTTLGDSLRVYLADGKVVAVQALDKAVKNYAMITDVDIGTASEARMGSKINPAKVTVLYADGTEETLALHKDSHYNKNGTDTIIDDATEKTAVVVIGNVVEYSMSGNKLKIEDVLAQDTNDLKNGTTAWDATNKRMRYVANASTKEAENVAVAATDALLFAFVEKDQLDASGNKKAGAKASAGDDFYVYNLRDLGDIKSTTSNPVKMNADLNSKNQVKVAVAELSVRPDGASSNTVYGIVNTFVGRATVGDTTYNRYIIAVEDEDMVVNYVGSLNEGDVVSFEVTNDDCYATNKITNLTANGTTKIVAIDDYKEDAKLLTYYGATKAKAGEVNVYEGYEDGTYAVKKPLSVTTDKDVKIIYVNAKDKTTGSSIGVNKFDDTTGKANAIINIIHKTDDDGDQDVVDVIVIETSGDGFDAVGFGDNDGAEEVSASDTATNKLSVADVKAAGEGAVKADKDAVKDSTAFPGSYVTVQDLMFFNVKTTAPNQTLKLVIKNSENEEVYSETSSAITTSGTMVTFYVDTKVAGGTTKTNGTWTAGVNGISLNNANGGVFTYTITDNSTNAVVFNDEFSL